MTTAGRPSKRSTGIPGLDNVTNGGLPAAGAALLIGPPGTGKTNLSLQMAVKVAKRNEPSVFVSFEEATPQLLANAASFTWGRELSTIPHLHLLDARPPVNAAASGTFDLDALLNLLPALTEPDQPAWLVLDGIDQLLAYERDTGTALQQVRGIHDWSQQNNVTTILTGKPPAPHLIGTEYVEAAKYTLPVVIQLTADLHRHHLIRRLRILKYRGSAHTTDDMPVVLNDDGFQLPYAIESPTQHAPASRNRVSTGVPPLDKILGGGVYEGSTTLISGSPGTAKTTLALHFVAAAAQRGDQALVVSYDEPSNVIIRDATSIGIHLQPLVDSKLLSIHGLPAGTAVAEEHVLALQYLIREKQPKVLVIDPVSALYKTTDPDNAYLSIEQILTTSRAKGITTILTSLQPHGAIGADETVSHASTLADTWIALDDRVIAGERNRALSIVKSRGTHHSNQVRELLLSDQGIDLADVYLFGSEFLMGTARLHAENQAANASRDALHERRQKRRDLEHQIEITEARLQELAADRARLQDALHAEQDDNANVDLQAARQSASIAAQRGTERPPDHQRPDDQPPAEARQAGGDDD